MHRAAEGNSFARWRLSRDVHGPHSRIGVASVTGPEQVTARACAIS